MSRIHLLYLVGILPWLLLFLVTPTAIHASDCASGGAGYDQEIITSTPQTTRIYLQDKDTDGTTLYHGNIADVCVYTTDVTGISILWQADGGITLETATGVTSNTHVTITLGSTYTGGACPDSCSLVSPIRIRVTDASAASDNSNYFFFVAPPFPDEPGSPGTPDLAYNFQPQYAIGGQVYNPVFNTALPVDGTADTYFYYPNTRYEITYGLDRTLPGLYADDVTYASQGYAASSGNQWAIFYWWLKTSVGFPAWTVDWRDSIRLEQTLTSMDLDALTTLQTRTFTDSVDSIGYIALVIDRETTDLSSTAGFWNEICLLCTTANRHFYGVWLPEHSGSYLEGTTLIPSELNGGYLQVVQAAGNRVLTEGQPNISENYKETGITLVNGDVTFAERVDNSFVDYRADLVNEQEIIVRSLLMANVDGIVLSRVPYSFKISTPPTGGTILIRDNSDVRLPAVRINLDTAANILLKEEENEAALDNFIADLQASPVPISLPNTAVGDAFRNFAAAWGLNAGAGLFLVTIVALAILILSFMRFLPSMIGVALLTIMGAILFTIMGLLQSWILFLGLLMIGMAVLLQVFVKGT